MHHLTPSLNKFRTQENAVTVDLEDERTTFVSKQCGKCGSIGEARSFLWRIQVHTENNEVCSEIAVKCRLMLLTAVHSTVGIGCCPSRSTPSVWLIEPKLNGTGTATVLRTVHSVQYYGHGVQPYFLPAAGQTPRFKCARGIYDPLAMKWI